VSRPNLYVVPDKEVPEVKDMVLCDPSPQTNGWITPTSGRLKMDQFDIFMGFVKETRDQQQKYLETIKSENTALIERYRGESLSLAEKIEQRLKEGTDRIEKSLTTFRGEVIGELGSVRRWYVGTIVTILLTGLVGCCAIVLSIWLTAK